MNILITGADGQLGMCILTVYRDVYYQNSKNNYHFVGRESVDITNKDSIEKWIKDYNIDYQFYVNECNKIIDKICPLTNLSLF